MTVVLSRSRSEDYFTLRGIRNITALRSYDLPMLPVKELMDNAADAAERKKDPFVAVEFKKDWLRVEDNGDGIPRNALHRIFDWERFASSKYYVFYPARGHMGAGIRTVIAYLSALAREFNLPPDAGYFRLRTRDYELTISNLRLVDGKIVDDRTLVDASERSGTVVEVQLPLEILSLDRVYDFMYSYVLINPWINFEINGTKFPAVTKFNVDKWTYASYYSLREFTDLVIKTGEEYPETTLTNFLKANFKTRFPTNLDPAKKLTELKVDDIKALYLALTSHENMHVEPFVGFIGRRPIARRLRQLYGDFERLVYKHARSGHESFEVWCAHAEEYKNNFITGINNTLPYENPIEKYYLYVNDGSEEKKRTLHEILRGGGINEEEPVLVLFHMFLPKPPYGGYAKTSIELTKLNCKTIGNLIHDACKWYAGHKGNDRAFIINKEELEKELTQIVLQYYKAGFSPTSRHIYYRAAHLNLYPFNRKGYRAVCEALLNARLEKRLPWDSISDRSRYWIDPIPKSASLSDLIDEFNGIIMHKLGVDPWRELGVYVEIWVEKDSYAIFLKPIAYKWLLVVAPSRGYSSWAYVWEGVKRISDYGYDNNVILYLGDFDPSGLDIQNHLEKAISHFNVKCEVRRIAVKEDDIKKLPPSPLKKTDPRLRRKYKDYIEKYGDNVWEIDAIDPQELYTRIENELKTLLDMEKLEKVLERNRSIKEHAIKMLDEIIKNIQC